MNRWLVLTWLALALIVVSAERARPAGADGEIRLQISGIDVSNYPNVRFVVTAQAQDGYRIPDLQPSNFAVSSQGRTLPVSSISSLREEPIGVSALLAIDASGSMAGTAIISARNAAQTFVDSLRPLDEVAVVSFADGVAMLAGFTNDLRAASAAIANISASGNTALYQAVVDSADAIKARTAERPVIILLSDGADFGGVSRLPRQESLRIAQETGVPFYIIGVGSQIDRQYLEELRVATGGVLFITPSFAQLQSTFSEIAVQVRSQYAVTLDLATLSLEGEIPVSLRVQLRGQSGQADFTFTAPPLVIPQEVPPTPRGSAAIPSWLLLSLPLLVLLAGLAYVWPRMVRRLSRRSSTGAAPAPIFRRDTAPFATRAGPGNVLLKLVAKDGTEFEVRQDVVTVGTSPEDTYKLPFEKGDVWAGSLRIWPSNGRVIIHDTSVRPRLQLNGKGATWAFLSHGDEIEIGSQRLTVSFIQGNA